MAYIQDLVQEVQLRLPKESLDNLELTNSDFSLNGGFWRTLFSRTYGASLPKEADYELEYVALQRVREPLYYLIRKGYNEVLVGLLQPAKYDDLLVVASKWGNIEVVKLLLNNGANIYADNDYSLQWAAYNGHLNVVKLLLDKGADVDTYYGIPLRLAAGNGHLEVVKLLLNRGANIHAANDVALQWAASNGHINVVKLLLDNGADIHANNDQALRWAADNGYLDIVKLLLDNGANIHAEDDEALQLTARKGRLDVVKLLIERGANLDALKPIGLPSPIQAYLSTLSQKQPETAQCTALTLKKTRCKKKAVKNGLCSIHM